MSSLVSYALCSVADVKESLGITNNSQDNLITRKINAATDMIENYCGRRFVSTVYTNEVYEGNGGDTINLKNYPVTNLSKLEVRNSSTNVDVFETIDDDYYFLDSNAGIIEYLAMFYGGFGRWRVTYTAGYTTIPYDLAEACATLAAYLTSQNPATIDSKVVQEGQRRQEFFDSSVSSKDIFGRLGIADVLDSYTTPVISGRP